ncbi:TPA: hypothetical protein ACTVL7_001441 [Escherichia coli]|uniref:Uncharacterized protein n=1 Tax=Citrobacter gillenii TaxID=67828 RepID=A0ABD6LXH8_9ENTR|nr:MULTISPECIES: hypothetical protein [Enterobacteriaceae]EFB1308987.1 hypothetical protein [Escherichia coli]MCB6152437.1 hypothetical protein [Escherichia coli]MCX3733556.1 hypothetical protein [Escherichia coli]MDA6496771.1 hypothetical protein [Escherichia coli]MDT7053384.1 hypothetical protein [Citrobacter freundii]
MKNHIIASVIIGVSVVFSALIISDNISFKNEHVIPLAGGSVKLGDVYKEEKLLSARLIFKEGEQVLISNGNPDDFSNELDAKITEILKTLNSGKSKNDERLTAENLSVIDDAKLEVTSAVRYTSEHQPLFTLTLDEQEISMVKGSYIKDFSHENIKKFIDGQQKNYQNALFLTK